MTFIAAWLAKYALGRWIQANWRLVLIGLGVIAVLLALWWLYASVWQRGYDEADQKWSARQRAAEAKAAADTQALHQAIAEIDTGITIDMEAINAVRTVFRDRVRTVAIAADRPGCAIADGLRGEINAAASQYAAAARSGSPAVHPAKPSP